MVFLHHVWKQNTNHLPTMSANAAVKELKAIGADFCENFEPSEFGEHPI